MTNVINYRTKFAADDHLGRRVILSRIVAACRSRDEYFLRNSLPAILVGPADEAARLLHVIKTNSRIDRPADYVLVSKHADEARLIQSSIMQARKMPHVIFKWNKETGFEDGHFYHHAPAQVIEVDFERTEKAVLEALGTPADLAFMPTMEVVADAADALRALRVSNLMNELLDQKTRDERKFELAAIIVASIRSIGRAVGISDAELDDMVSRAFGIPAQVVDLEAVREAVKSEIEKESAAAAAAKSVDKSKGGGK